MITISYDCTCIDQSLLIYMCRREYHIRSFRRRGYYLFHRLSLCGVYSRAATIREWRLLPHRQSLEKRSMDTTDLVDSGPIADVEEG